MSQRLSLKRNCKLRKALILWVIASIASCSSVRQPVAITANVVLTPYGQPSNHREISFASQDDLISANTVVAMTLRAWYEAKSRALGPEWDIDVLDKILLEPALSRWTTKAQQLAKDGIYLAYKHTFEIVSVEMIAHDTITAKVNLDEAAEAYQFGLSLDSLSFQENFQIEYQLKQQDNRWMITSFQLSEDYDCLFEIQLQGLCE